MSYTHIVCTGAGIIKQPSADVSFTRQEGMTTNIIYYIPPKYYYIISAGI